MTNDTNIWTNVDWASQTIYKSNYQPKEKIKPSKELYGKIIESLKSMFPEGVIIAGGCLRDLVYGYDPKDVDIFVNLQTELDLELRLDEAIHYLEKAGLGQFSEQYNIFEQTCEEGGYGSENEDRDIEDRVPSCTGVFELYFKHFEPAIQIIAKPLEVFDGPSLVSTFDYNLVQQYIDTSDGEVKGDNGTMKQIMERALYLRKTGDKKTEERLKRFLDRTSFEPSNKEEHPEIFGKKNANNLAMRKLGSVFVIEA